MSSFQSFSSTFVSQGHQQTRISTVQSHVLSPSNQGYKAKKKQIGFHAQFHHSYTPIDQLPSRNVACSCGSAVCSINPNSFHHEPSQAKPSSLCNRRAAPMRGLRFCTTSDSLFDFRPPTPEEKKWVQHRINTENSAKEFHRIERYRLAEQQAAYPSPSDQQ